MEYKQYIAACAALNQTPMQLADFNIYPEEDRVSKFALHRIYTVTKADNLTADKWKQFKKNWKERSQWSWQPWYKVVDDDSRPAGVGFSFDGAANFGATDATVGSRLGFFSSERVRAVMTTAKMIETYNEYMG